MGSPSMHEAKHIPKSLAIGQETSFVASVVGLRALAILQKRDHSRLRGVKKTGMWFPLLNRAAQLCETIRLVASLHWLQACEGEVFLASWVPVVALEVRLVKQWPSFCESWARELLLLYQKRSRHAVLPAIRVRALFEMGVIGWRCREGGLRRPVGLPPRSVVAIVGIRGAAEGSGYLS